MKHFAQEMISMNIMVSEVLIKEEFTLNEHTNLFFPPFLFSVVNEAE